jgi:metallo-beta-lactamase class B
MMKKLSPLAAAVMITAFAGPCAVAGDPPAAELHVRKAMEIARDRFASTASMLCDPNGTLKIAALSVNGSERWLPPTWMFDDLAYVGNEFVGVFVVKTKDGLILFDSGESSTVARDHIVPGLRQLGLDPSTIRYVVVTHGHWDHYGGAKYFQETFNARVAMASADWDLVGRLPLNSIERAPMFGSDRSGRPAPRRDIVVSDGDRLTLGGKTIRLLVTPGHTLGTVSALIPVTDKGGSHLMSLLGGTAFPRTLGPSGTMGGLINFSKSIEKLGKMSKSAKADGVINTHVFVDGTLDRLKLVNAHAPAIPNPFVMGRRAVDRYYRMFDQCLMAASARPLTPVDFSKIK